MATLTADDLTRSTQQLDIRYWNKLQSATVLITGGTGFVGKWLLATLLNAAETLSVECTIFVLTRNPEQFASDYPHLAAHRNVRLKLGDVRSIELADITPTHIIHAATDVARNVSALETFDTSVVGTRRILDLARRCNSKVLLISSGAVYGPQPTDTLAISEDFMGGPDILATSSAYSEGKRASEWLAATYAREFGIEIFIARCFALVGPYLPLDAHFAIGNIIGDALSNRAINIVGDGTAVRSYLYAADMAAWLWLIVLAGRPGVAYNVGGEEAVSIVQLAERVVSLLGLSVPINILGRPAVPRMINRYVPDVTQLRSELHPTAPLSLDEAILRTAAWHAPDRTTASIKHRP